MSNIFPLLLTLENRIELQNCAVSCDYLPLISPQMNEGEQASLLTMVSMDGILLSVINEASEEVALVSMSSMPAMWQIEVKNKWKVLEDVTLVTWLEDKWIHGLSQASLEDRIEVRIHTQLSGGLCSYAVQSSHKYEQTDVIFNQVWVSAKITIFGFQ